MILLAIGIVLWGMWKPRGGWAGILARVFTVTMPTDDNVDPSKRTTGDW